MSSFHHRQTQNCSSHARNCSTLLINLSRVFESSAANFSAFFSARRATLAVLHHSCLLYSANLRARSLATITINRSKTPASRVLSDRSTQVPLRSHSKEGYLDLLRLLSLSKEGDCLVPPPLLSRNKEACLALQQPLSHNRGRAFRFAEHERSNFSGAAGRWIIWSHYSTSADRWRAVWFYAASTAGRTFWIYFTAAATARRWSFQSQQQQPQQGTGLFGGLGATSNQQQQPQNQQQQGSSLFGNVGQPAPAQQQNQQPGSVFVQGQVSVFQNENAPRKLLLHLSRAMYMLMQL